MSRPRAARIAARAILIAAGGAGQVYSDTTNPAVATGDGIALAACAGAELADMEFYQFHPTALAIEGAPRFLVSEALRGEGAYLRNDRGERFMERYHPLLELAPRDVVARAIAREGLADSPARRQRVCRAASRLSRHAPRARHRSHRALSRHQRVPRAIRPRSAPRSHPRAPRRALPHGRHPHRSRRPHQSRGLLRRRRSRLHRRPRRQSPRLELSARRPRLRRARRSLHACRCVSARFPPGRRRTRAPHRSTFRRPRKPRVETLIAALQASMWANAGLLREASSLQLGLAALAACETSRWPRSPQLADTSRRLAEALALSRVAHAILVSALVRTESRGAHFRSDYPRHDNAYFRKHSVLSGDGKVRFEAW